MPTTRPELTGYAVTLEVVVPLARARREAERLDRAWHNESWSTEAAAYEAVREALEKAGLDRTTSISTHEVFE